MAQPIQRRAVIGGRAAITAASPDANAKADARHTIGLTAERLAAAMAAVHGGNWSAHVNHDSGFVFIMPASNRGCGQQEG